MEPWLWTREMSHAMFSINSHWNSTINLMSFRNRFASLENCVHLISGLLGAIPDGPRAATTRFHDLWASRDFLVDYRPGAGLRVSPHLYSADEKLDAGMTEIDPFVSA